MKEVVRKTTKNGRYISIFEKEEAVSPVIATILMVAITVVLAATVYILVSHYTSVGSKTPFTASLAEQSEASTTATLVLTYTSPSTNLDTGTFSITLSGGALSSPYVLTATLSSTTSSTSGYIESGATITITYTGSTSSVSFDVSISNPDGSTWSFGTTGTASSYTWSGISVSMVDTSYSGTASTVLP